MKPRYTDAFWGEHPFDGDMILNKNKNNKNRRPGVQLVYRVGEAVSQFLYGLW